MVQVPHIAQTRGFHIENHDLGAVFGDSFAEFLSGAGEVYRMEVRGKTTGQRLSDHWIALENYCTEAHKSS
jgi:hypothetical protein